MADNSETNAAEQAFIAKQSADDAPVKAVDSTTKPVPAPDPVKSDETDAAESDSPDPATSADASSDDDTDGAADQADEAPADADDEDESAQDEATDITTTDPDEFPEVKADDEFESALKKHGVTLKLDDIKDAEVKALVSRRLSDMEKGFTKAMQEARSYRSDEVKLKAEERFRKDHTVDYLVSVLLERPELGEQVNAKLDRIADPDVRQAHATNVERAREKALQAEQGEQAQRSSNVSRGEVVERYVQAAASKAGMPYELVAPAIALHITQNKDITRAQVDAYIAQHKATYDRHVRAHRREQAKVTLKAQLSDQKKGGLKAKPGVGMAAGPGRKNQPKNDAEFVEMMAASLS